MPLNRLTLPAFVALAAFASSTAAAGLDYDLLIVACNESACRRVAERTLAGGPADTAEYNQDGLKLQIETVAMRADAVDARVSLDVHPPEDGDAALRSGMKRLAQRMRVYVEPCTLRQGAFSSIASFVNAGSNYHVWARLAAMR